LELGTFPLKDLGPRVPLIQIKHPDLESDFPLPQNTGGSQHNLPSQLTSLVGRIGDADDVDELIRSHRLVTLLGAGGVGKTRLALQVAANLGDEYSDGVWLVELATIEDPAQVLDEVRRAMRVPDDGQGERTLIHAIHDDDVLIILDNCEHLLDGVAQTVDLLLRECPGVRILATSREPLDTPGEVRWRVPSLPVADAVELMTERAQLVAPNLIVTDAERAILARVCRRLDGIPLAIELVAGRLGTIPIEEIESRLLDRLRLLSTGARGQVPRHKTLGTALDWSYQLLSEDEQTLLRRLAVFPGTFDLRSAEQICSDDEIDQIGVHDLIESLQLKSLLTVDRQQDPPLVMRSESVAQFADSLLRDEERQTISERHALRYLNTSVEALYGLRRQERSEWMTLIDSNRDNLVASYDWLALHRPDDAARMIVNVKEWLVASMSAPWLTRIRDLSERTDISSQSIAMSNALRSMLAGLYGFEPASVSTRTSTIALQHVDAISDQRDRIRALTNLAGGCRETDPGQATALTELAITEAEALGDEAVLVASTVDLLAIHHEHHPITQRLRDAALDLMAANGAWSSLHPLVDSALALHQVGDHHGAIAALNSAEEMLPSASQSRHVMTEDAQVWFIWSVLIQAETGNTSTAILLAEDALQSFRDDSSLGAKTLMGNYGQALLIEGRLDEAEAAFNSALELEDAWRYVCFAIASLGLAEINLRRGNHELCVQQMSRLSQENQRPWVQARAFDLLARASLHLELHADAAKHAEQADSLRRHGGYVVPPALRPADTALRDALADFLSV